MWKSRKIKKCCDLNSMCMERNHRQKSRPRLTMGRKFGNFEVEFWSEFQTMKKNSKYINVFICNSLVIQICYNVVCHGVFPLEMG